MSLFCSINGAENGTRTRDPNLGKVVLYQLSYFRLFCEKSAFSAAPRQKQASFLLLSACTKIPLFSEHSPECGCKGNAFFGTDKLFGDFFCKKLPFYRKKGRLECVNPCDFYSLRSKNGEELPKFHPHATSLSRDG